MRQIQVLLTPAESKRLIAKAVAGIDEVQNAMKSGIIVIGVGTTNAIVAEELLHIKIDRERFVAGVTLPKGNCVLPAQRRLHEIVVKNGRVTGLRLEDVLHELGPSDVLIKGANAVDASGVAGVFLGSKSGGTIGRSIGTLLARGVNIVMPVSLEKFIPGSIVEIARLSGTDKAEYSVGVPLGLMPVPGKLVTEIEAIRILSGAKAVVMGRGGVSGAEGAITFVIFGDREQLEGVRRLVLGIKGERNPVIETDCETCDRAYCGMKVRLQTFPSCSRA